MKRIFGVHPTRLANIQYVVFFLLLHSILRFARFKPFWLELWKNRNIIFLWMSSINQHLSLTNRQILTSEKPLLLLRWQKIKKTWQICQSCLPGWSKVKKKKLQWAQWQANNEVDKTYFNLLNTNLWMCFCTVTFQISWGILLQFLVLQGFFWSLENCNSNNNEKKRNLALLEAGLGVYGEKKQSRQRGSGR